MTFLETVDVGLVNRPDTLVPLEHLAVAKGWMDEKTRDDFLRCYEAVPEEGPTGEPFIRLDQALECLKEKWQDLPRILDAGDTWEKVRELEGDIKKKLESLMPSKG